MKRKSRVGASVLAIATAISAVVPAMPTPAVAASPDAFRGQLETVAAAKADGNVVNLSFNDGAVSARITFLEEGIFRYNVDPTGEFSEYATPNSSSHMGRIQQYPDSSENYSHPNASVSESDGAFTITSGNTSIVFDKNTALMTVKNGDTVVMQEKEALRISDGSTVQTLVKKNGEDFFGGGTQNGRFLHTGDTISIVNESSWTDGGVSSPNPFYYTTGGYGVLRNTFKPGSYDFGDTTADTVVTTHNESELDAYYFVSDSNNKRDTVQTLLQEYFHVTGNPVLLPEYAFYLGHLNNYNRDSWDTSNTNSGYGWTIKGNDSHTSTGTTTYEGGRAAGYTLTDGQHAESLNGERATVSAQNFPAGVDTPYEYSARSVLDNYLKYDMPLGYFIPNDGYGGGYGQNGYYVTGGVNADGSSSQERLDAVAANVQNLADFTKYANENGVATGLWTQSYLVPDSNPNTYWHLLRDFASEVKVGGITTLKTDVAWVGPGYSMQLDGVKTSYDIVTTGVGMRPNIISLNGWAGSQRYNAVWTGDQTGGNWEYIRFHIPTYIGQSLAGNPNVGSDMDGIFGGDPLISARDYQWKSMTPLMLDMDGWGTYVKAPYTHGDPYTGISRMYLKLKAQMMPYTYTNAYAAANLDTGNNDTGLPMVRAMFLEFPDDAYAASEAMQYQYMYGSSLLTAPVYQNTAADEMGNDIRNNIYLPGEDTIWIDYFTGKQYVGGQSINGFDAPLWKLPLFVKNGAIIPMYEENNSSLLVDKSNRIVEFWPAGSTEYTVIEDDGSTMTNTTTEDEAYGTIDNISYGPHVSTRLTSTVEGDVATLTAEPSKGTYTGYDANKNTEFVVNVSQEPGSVVAKNGDQELTIKKVDSLEAFDNTTPEAGTAVYFYDAAPSIETYASAEETELLAMVADVEVAPKLHVKFAETDASANAQTLVINGFVNEGTFDKNELNPNLGTPANVAAAEENKTPTSIQVTWDAVEGATGYDVMVDGIINAVGNVTSFAHTDLAYNSEHTYQVRARNTDGYSEWSAVLTSSSLQDPWRNVPNATVSWSGGDQWGALKNATDHDTSTMFHSTGDVVTNAVPFIMDFGNGYQLDEFVYYPRDNKGNGLVTQMDVYTSLDGENWTLAHDGTQNTWTYGDASVSVEDDAKTVDLSGVMARYVKLVVRKSSGNFFSANELAVYKVDGTKAFAVGSKANDGRLEVTDTDYSNMKNYLGISTEDSSYQTQVKAYAMDINANGYYDVYDYAYTMFKLDGGTTKTGNVSGNALLLTNATALSAGQTLSVDVYADNVENLNAFGEILRYDISKLEFVGVEQGAGVNSMEDLSINKVYDGEAYVNLAFANRGDKELYQGTGILATVTMRAKTDIPDVTEAMELSQVTLIGPNYSTVVSDASSTPEIPEIPTETVVKYGMDDFTITMTNDVLTEDDGTNVEKITQNDSYAPLFNGTVERTFEFMWALASSPEDTANLLPDYVKLPTTMHVAFHKAVPLTNFIVYNANPVGNGKLTSAEATVTFEDGSSKQIQLLEEQVNYDFAVESDLKVTQVDITFLSATGTANYDDPQTNRMLSLGEIEFLYTERVPVESIAPAQGNATELFVGYLGDVNAVVLPESTPNKFFTATSSNPEVASIITLADANGYPIYKVRGMSEGTATITLTSAADQSITASYDVTVRGGVDKSGLQAVYDACKNVVRDLYTADSYAAFEAQLKHAEEILAKEDAARAEVDEAIDSLQQAYAGLEVVPVSENLKLDAASAVTSVDGQYSESNVAGNMFDGSLETYWESPYSGDNAKLPQNVVVTLDKAYALEQVTFISHSIQNGGVTEYEVYVLPAGQDPAQADDSQWVKVAAGHRDAAAYKQGANVTVHARFLPIEAGAVKLTVLGAVGRIPEEDNKYARIAEMQLFGSTMEEPGVTVETDTGITVNNAGDVFEGGTVVTIQQVTQGDIYNRVESALEGVATMDQAGIFQFAATKDGAAVAPSGAMDVTFPIPDGFDSDSMKLYYVDEAGTRSEISLSVNTQTNTAAVQLSTLGTYVMVNLVSSEPNPDPTEEPSQGVKVENNSNTQITMGNANQVFTDGTVIRVDEITQGEIYDRVQKALAHVTTMDKAMVLEITALRGGQPVQPTAPVQVTIQIPAHLTTSNLRLYYVAEDGKLTQVPITVDTQANTVTANLSHFSTYVLANITSGQGGGAAVPGTGDTQNVMPYVVAMLISLTMLTGAVLVSKRYRK